MLIDIRNMFKIYRMGDTEVNALDGISLTINAGEFVRSEEPRLNSSHSDRSRMPSSA